MDAEGIVVDSRPTGSVEAQPIAIERRAVDGDDAHAVERRWMRQLGMPPSLISALLERSAAR